MNTIITSLPRPDSENPIIWRITDGLWRQCGTVSDFVPDADDTKIMVIASPSDTRCIWSSLPDLEPRQAEAVARLRATEQSLGPVHAVSRHISDGKLVAATISPALMEYGLVRLALCGINPDIIIPAGLAIDPHPNHVICATFDGINVLRWATFATPDEPVFRDLLVGDYKIEPIATDIMRSMLLAASDQPLLNLREGTFAKREQNVWATPAQHRWVRHLAVALAVVTLLVGIATWAKYRLATNAEDERTLAAAQKIDPSIVDPALAEAQLDRALQQRGLSKARLAPLAAGLWRAVKAAPNVSVRELRYGTDGIMTVVLAAPTAESINKALIAIQQEGYRVTAIPRQDTTGATLVDLTMRLP